MIGHQHFAVARTHPSPPTPNSQARALVTAQEPQVPLSRGREENEIHGRFVYADSFGNSVTNIFARDIPEDWNPQAIRIEGAGQVVFGISSTYGEREPGELVALFGSSGQLELSVVQGDAAQKYGIQAEMPVKITHEST